MLPPKDVSLSHQCHSHRDLTQLQPVNSVGLRQEGKPELGTLGRKGEKKGLRILECLKRRIFRRGKKAQKLQGNLRFRKAQNADPEQPQRLILLL